MIILLRLRVKYHCTMEKSTRQSYTCQLVSFELFFKTHYTLYIKHQDLVNVKAFIPY